MLTSSSNSPSTSVPAIRLLSNDLFCTALTEQGSGYSKMGSQVLSRWSNDGIENGAGYYIYLRDLDDGAVWSACLLPVRRAGASYACGEQAGSVWYSCNFNGIQTYLEVSVDSTRALEIRQLRIKNSGNVRRRIEVTSYLEVVLNDPASEASHPAFSKLFIQTEFEAGQQALLARRRARGANEAGLWMMHAIRLAETDITFETDRKRFIGRGHSLAAPNALSRHGDEFAPLSGTAGNVLDAALSLRCEVGLEPDQEHRLLFLLGAGADKAGALDLLADIESIAPAVGSFGLVGDWSMTAPHEPVQPAMSVPAMLVESRPLQCFNGYGGFNAAGDEYVIRINNSSETPPNLPPLPWTNVIANEKVGFLVSESGASCTWSRNSREHRFTPWYNDPVCDPHGEAWYIRDNDNQAFWSATPGPVMCKTDYEVSHGFGYSRFEHQSHGLLHETTMYVPRHDTLKIVRIRLTNLHNLPRSLSVYSYQRLVLGASLDQDALAVITTFDADSTTLLARNALSGVFSDGVVFAACTTANAVLNNYSYTTDRAAFIGMNRSPANPLALDPLEFQPQLDRSTGAGMAPCFAQQVSITVAPNAICDVFFLLGEGSDQAAALALSTLYQRAEQCAAAFSDIRQFWRKTVSTFEISTPVPAIDLMVNGWLSYQNLSCRIWGRSAFYQSGGAYGFRDQLQDSSAMIYADPQLTRAQICLHAAHQFIEGDVLHWWHPAPLEKGMRTRFADDLLWLPYIVAFYINTTGDVSVLDEQSAFLCAPLLDDGEDERMVTPDVSDLSADVYEHCCLALDRSLRLGMHGLPLMGTGDWNDGMSRVGREGRGESVWMGFFLYRIITDFMPLCVARNDAARIERYQKHVAALQTSLNDAGWDGQWYRRAFYDNGNVMGSTESDECQIDALAQAWSVISGVASTERASLALDAVDDRLISDSDRLIKLLTPAFVNTQNDPGYIKGYVAGVRENGGQYTHAACWVVRAMAESGRSERAARLLENLSPVSHSSSLEGANTYQVEPYVIAADIYGEAPHVGRGGWTWYTGSAGWMYRVALESVLGFTLTDGDKVRLAPVIPKNWPGFTLRYRLPDGQTSYLFEVQNQAGNRRLSVCVDGIAVDTDTGTIEVALKKDGASHHVLVQLINQ